MLEELEHAKARGAKIYAEIVGYGATSDGYDMVAPSGEGAARCMKLALQGVDRTIDYLNPHGTSTPVGDIKEMEAVRTVFGAKPPLISSTKSLTGHSLGATGVQESIYCILMMQHGFLCESANIEQLDPEFEDMPILRARKDNAKVGVALSNSVPEIMIWRLIQALGTSGGMSVGAAVIGDIYKLTQRGTAMGIFFGVCPSACNK